MTQVFGVFGMVKVKDMFQDTPPMSGSLVMCGESRRIGSKGDAALSKGGWMLNMVIIMFREVPVVISAGDVHD